MINKLVLENLKHRPVRTLLSVVAIAIEVAMMLTLVGLSRGMLDEAARRARGVGADIWVRPPGSSVISLGTAPMPEGLVKYFEEQPHVKIATGTIAQAIGGIDTVTGLDLEKFGALNGGFRYVAGGPFQGEDDIMVDERYAKQNHLKVGSTIKVLNRDWRISGIFESGKLARMVLPLKRLQDLTSNTGKLTQIFVKLDDPKLTTQVLAEFKKKMPDYAIYSIEEFTSLFSVNGVKGLREFITVVIVLSAIVGFLVVFLSMYTAVLERTREIGVLKSLGASPSYILSILLRETFMLAVIGTVLGIAMSFGTRWLILEFAGATLTSMITPDWWPNAAIIAIGGALLGAMYPGWKAIRQDALEALSYE
ncbi:MAG: FtsX-like permease family protein [Acidobacteriota bacterium]